MNIVTVIAVFVAVSLSLPLSLVPVDGFLETWYESRVAAGVQIHT
jgi:hypothetical protein